MFFYMLKNLVIEYTDCFVICIGGYNFEYIQEISDFAKSNLKLANKILYKLITFFAMKYSN